MRWLWGWLFYRPEERLTFWQVIAWWEIRRIPYNILVGSVGAISFLLFMVIAGQPGMVPPGEDAVEPLALLFAPVAVNICYSFGGLTELILRGVFGSRPRIGPAILKGGLILSVVVVLVPTVFTFAAWLKPTHLGR